MSKYGWSEIAKDFQTVKQSNADHIRALSDEELATAICKTIGLENVFCCEMQECDTDIENDTPIPEERCIGCALNWLKQPWEGKNGLETRSR